MIKKGFVVCILLSILFASGCQREKETKVERIRPERVVPVKVIEARKEDVVRTLKAIGSLIPQEEVDVSAEVEGEIEEVLRDEGESVKKGELLLKFNEEEFRLKRDRAKALYSQVEVELDRVRKDFARKERLFKEGYMSKEEYDTVLSSLNLLEARLREARASLDLAERDLRDTAVYSPLDGFIQLRMAAPGEYVRVGNPLFKILNIDPIKVSFTLPEGYLREVRVGSKVAVEGRGLGGERLEGVVTFIAPRVDPSTRSFELRAEIPNPKKRLKPGLFVDVTLFMDKERGILLPERAILMREGERIAFIIKDERAYERKVSVGLRIDGRIEVLSGIEEGEIVVIEGNSGLLNGDKVKIIED